jgi:putative hemolysin
VAEPAAETPPIPRLLSAYLALGARICGSPAIDREFGTLDFLTLLDLEGIPERIRIRWGLEPNPVGKTFL